MKMFVSKNGAKYQVLDNGVIEQIDPKKFIYDKDYIATYDTEAYKRGNETLQAMRYAFATAAHGRPINSILDVGCANGAFLKFAQQQVENAFGFDVTNVRVSGINIVPWMVNAEVYTFHDVLEHIYDCSFIKKLSCETISISLPYCYYDTLGQDWFDNKYRHLKKDEHIRHFNHKSLENFMRELGWCKVALSYHEDIVRKGTSPTLHNILSMAFKRIQTHIKIKGSV